MSNREFPHLPLEVEMELRSALDLEAQHLADALVEAFGSHGLHYAAGDPAFERQHPRDDDGKFAEKDSQDPPKQKRAKPGGEMGPNQEWYKGGAWIATTDMPKRQREKWERAANKERYIETGVRSVVPAGKIPIFDTLLRVGGFNERTGRLNDRFLEYSHVSEEDRKLLGDLVEAYTQGERFADLLDYQPLVNFADIANMAMNDMPVPAALVVRFAEYRKEDPAKTLKALGGKVLTQRSE